MSARITSRRKSRPAPKHWLFGRLLDPIDWLSETIYSVLIMLTFTLAFRVFSLSDNAPRVPAESLNDLFVAALGAILAWGMIDGVMYVLMEVFQRSERHRLLRLVQAAATEQEGVKLIAEELDYVLAPITGEAERQTLYRSVFAQLRGSWPRPVGFVRADFGGALGCVLVAVGAVIPSLAPLVLLRHDYTLAVRVSNLVSFAVLFAAGYRWGVHTGASPWKTGLLLVAVGTLMVAIAIPFGG